MSSPMLVVCVCVCVRGFNKSNCKGRTKKKIVAESIHFRVVEYWKSNVRETERERERQTERETERERERESSL